MNNFKSFILVLFLSWVSSCSSDKRVQEKPESTGEAALTLSLSHAELEDKVKGMLIGSAIGDAMGAPTEMWGRDAIYREYGWVTQLDNMVREVSPEGIWKVNLPAGGTTDDTRWKKLTFEYLEEQNDLELDPIQFSEHILEEYEMYFEDFKTLQPEETEALEYANLRVLWLQEWYKVARPLRENNLMGYQKALGKFYGGEMVCAGLLYSPALGLFYPGKPEKAYEQAFNLSLFDLGYAKDISALSAAMTAAAMTAAGDPENMLEVLRRVDPESYFKSRLVGRSSYRILQTALSIVDEAKSSSTMENVLNGQDESPTAAIRKAFELLDEQLQDMPFHAGEIHLQVLTAMLFSEFKFLDTLVFLVNYGRDNDTTAALAGAILGTYHGFENLPENMKTQVIEINKNELDIDLVGLAEKQTDRIYSLYKGKE